MEELNKTISNSSYPFATMLMQEFETEYYAKAFKYSRHFIFVRSLTNANYLSKVYFNPTVHQCPVCPSKCS